MNDWYDLNWEEYQFFITKGCVERRITCPKGSLVLWDSRTIHCGAEPLITRQNPNFRACLYVCYQPRKMIDEDNLMIHQMCFNKLRMTHHWVTNVFIVPEYPFGITPELSKITKIPKPVLNELGLKLAGF